MSVEASRAAADRGAPCARLLLVEDDPVNRALIARALVADGFAVTAVASGTEALRALDEAPVDAVLMDCRMPGLDGLETTRILRARERERGATRTPVIAVTASTMRGEHERALAAGMDDLLTKPASVRRLREVVARFVPAVRARARGPSDAPASAPRERATPALDVGAFRTATAYGPDLAREITELFRTDTQARLARLGAALHAGDLPGIAREAHAIAGASANVGATRAPTLARNLERACALGSDARLVALCDALGRELAAVLVAMEAALDAPAATRARARPERRA